jgi:hypothetical protein
VTLISGTMKNVVYTNITDFWQCQQDAEKWYL